MDMNINGVLEEYEKAFITTTIPLKHYVYDESYNGIIDSDKIKDYTFDNGKIKRKIFPSSYPDSKGNSAYLNTTLDTMLKEFKGRMELIQDEDTNGYQKQKELDEILYIIIKELHRYVSSQSPEHAKYMLYSWVLYSQNRLKLISSFKEKDDEINMKSLHKKEEELKHNLILKEVVKKNALCHSKLNAHIETLEYNLQHMQRTIEEMKMKNFQLKTSTRNSIMSKNNNHMVKMQKENESLQAILLEKKAKMFDLENQVKSDHATLLTTKMELLRLKRLISIEK